MIRILTLFSIFFFAQISFGVNVRIGFFGVWDRSVPLIERAARETHSKVIFFEVKDLIPPAEGKPSEKLSKVNILYILNFGTEISIRLQQEIQKAKQKNNKLKVIPLDARSVHQSLKKLSLLNEDKNVSSYWRPNGLANMKRLLLYTRIHYFKEKGKIPPPLIIPDYGFYSPKVEDIISTFADFKKRSNWQKDKPIATLLIQQSFWITQDIKVINAEIAALQKEGINVITLFADTTARLRKMLMEVKPQLIIEDRHGSIWEGENGKSILEELGVPYLRPISMLASTIAEWRKDPSGLTPRDISHFMTLQESKGVIEPIVVGGLKVNVRGFRLHEPIKERITHFAKRASSWVNLQTKANKDKKVAIIYYNKSLGKDDLMRGSPTGAFLDGPESMIRFLPRLKKAGYSLENIPKTAKELIKRMQKKGRTMGEWARAEIEALADIPNAVLISKKQYDEWFYKKLKPYLQAAVIKKFGPPPGKLMIVKRNQKDYILLPLIRLGNIILTPQPPRGEDQDENLLHSRDVPPPHNYLAFYWWLQEGFKADAIIHWGTHGSLELLPGKEAGLSADDWSDICTGTMPVINPWIMDNLGEATLSRRRSYALLVDHLIPASTEAGLTDELRLLHDDMDKFELLEQGVLKEEFRKSITDGIKKARIDETLHIDFKNRNATDDEIRSSAKYIHGVYSSRTPQGLHILGQPYSDKYIPSCLVGALQKSFLDDLNKIYQVPKEEDDSKEHKYQYLALKGQELMRKTVLGNEKAPPQLAKYIKFAKDLYARLISTDAEISNIIKGLDGKYIPPGPGPDPIRNPSSVPSGRNLYTLNPEEIPTPASWRVAIQLVKQMLKIKTPKKVGIDLNGMNTMRDFGVMEGQIFYLIGVEPVWDRNKLVIDVKIIPAEELKRARIDVFVAMGGQYKENFPSRVKLIDKAIRLVSELKEKNNNVRKGSQALYQSLIKKGFSEKNAKELSSARVFGTKQGNMSGTKILYLVPRSGVWDKKEDITSVYISNMSYVYSEKFWGKKIDGLYKSAIQGTDTLVRVWASNMTSQLSNHHAYEYLGGLSMAVKQLTGKLPDAFIADVRDPSGAVIREFEEVLATNLRSELLNRIWIKNMMKHNYAGAGHMSELVKNTFGWDVTREGSVSDGVWKDIYDTYIKDKYKLKINKWFDKNNPHAQQVITATMLEAIRKGYWKASDKVRKDLVKKYAQSVIKHGSSEGLVSGGNKKLENYIRKNLKAIGLKTLAEKYVKAKEKSTKVISKEKVAGVKLEQEKKQGDKTQKNKFYYWEYLLGLMIASLLLIGWLRKTGEAS